MDKVFEWVKPDWSKLEATFPRRGYFYVGERDMEKFLEDEFLVAEIETGISREEFINANLDFFEAKEQLFSSIYCIDGQHARLLAIEELLRVPKLC